MNIQKCALAVRLRPNSKQIVEDTIARYVEETAKFGSPFYITVSLKLDELNQVTEMHTDWKTDKESAYRNNRRVTLSCAIGLSGRLSMFSQRIGVKLSPFYPTDILNTFRYLLKQIPILAQYIEITSYQSPPNYTPMKLVVYLHPDSDEGKNHLAQFITESLGQKNNDWFALRFNLSFNRNTGVVHCLYIGTGWETPQWAEFSDRGPSFAEKQRFQTFFQDWFKEAGTVPNPSTPEAVAHFFEVMLNACPELSSYFTIIEK